MRHSVILKFIAVLLCAASLLTAIGSGLGMVLLTELNLYNKTVDQVMDDQLRGSGQYYARQLALHYASTTLGGCPDEMAEQIYGSLAFPAVYKGGNHGSIILDAEGNVLQTYGAEFTEGSRMDTFTVSGQYAHLLSVTPSRQAAPTEATSDTPLEGGTPLMGNHGVYDAIPAGGIVEIYSLTVGYSDGSGEGYGSDDAIGILFRNAEGQAVFQATAGHLLEYVGSGLDITYIAFRDSLGNPVYEAADSGPVGKAAYDANAYVTFVSTLVSTVDGTKAQDVSRVVFYGVSNPHFITLQVYATNVGTPAGRMDYDSEGHLYVLIDTLKNPAVTVEGAFVEASVSRIVLYDSTGRQILDHWGLGTVSVSEDMSTIQYYSQDILVEPARQAAASAETIPVTVPQETVPLEIPGETTPVSETQPPETAPQEGAVPESASETLPLETAPVETAAETTPYETTAETLPGETVPPTVPATVPTEATVPATTEPQETYPPLTEPVLVNGRPVTEFGISTTEYYDPQAGDWMRAEFVYLPLPEYTIQVHTTSIPPTYETAVSLLTLLRNLRNDLFLILGASLLVFAAFAVYLCWSAGHSAGTKDIHAGGLNRMPLDLYLMLGGSGVTMLIVLIVFGFEELLSESLEVLCGLTVVCSFFISLILVGFLFAVVAQCKTPGGFWWRNTLMGRITIFCIKSLLWLDNWLVRNIGKLPKGFWQLIQWVYRIAVCVVMKIFSWVQWIYQRTVSAVTKIFAWAGGLIQRFLVLLPLTWQWIFGGCVLLLLCVLSWANRNDGWGTLWLVLALSLVLYVSHCFGVLSEGTRRMSKGDLDSKVDDKHMVGCFRDFAGNLNDLADVAVVAAQKQLKSERMKSELVTNVSHDIKTPLTSIINYVDLLQKPHSEEEGQQYLEVLDRQSQRLKKLIEDLMDMSKANTGNMNVEIVRLDAVESVNQALGEFADKLETAQLIPVFRHANPEAMIMADGRLVWRVLSNLLSNAVKYAMPGTRLYIDLIQLEAKVVISIKNISRDELNIDAEELMERFVRGDDARNTEGSGLGLNIAKSLMELQKGHLQLLVDGDLFKVSLVFPGAE